MLLYLKLIDFKREYVFPQDKHYRDLAHLVVTLGFIVGSFKRNKISYNSYSLLS